MSRWLRFTLAVLFPAVSTVAVAEAELTTASSPVRIFVTAQTEENGLVVMGASGLLDSVKDLQKQLAKKAKDITIVGSQEEADITLEVLERGQVGYGAHKGISSKVVAVGAFFGENEREIFLRTRLTAGDYEVEVIGKIMERGTVTPWRDVSSDVAYQVREFVKQNRSKFGATKQHRGSYAVPHRALRCHHWQAEGYFL